MSGHDSDISPAPGDRQRGAGSKLAFPVQTVAIGSILAEVM
jgi:hypothetical protein